MLLCRRCASRMWPVADRDALECELCGHGVTGEVLTLIGRWRRRLLGV